MMPEYKFKVLFISEFNLELEPELELLAYDNINLLEVVIHILSKSFNFIRPNLRFKTCMVVFI